MLTVLSRDTALLAERLYATELCTLKLHVSRTPSESSLPPPCLFLQAFTQHAIDQLFSAGSIYSLATTQFEQAHASLLRPLARRHTRGALTAAAER